MTTPPPTPTGAVPAASGQPSLNAIFGYAREEYGRQIERHETLVTRSATLLGFVAVFIGLVAASPFNGWVWRVTSTAGLVLLVWSVVYLVRVVRLHTYKGAPATDVLIKKGFLALPEADTVQQALADTLEAIEKNAAVLEEVMRKYRKGAWLAAFGTGVIASAVVLGLFLG